MRPFAGEVQFFFWTRWDRARHFTTSEGDCTARTRCEGRCRLPSETRAASPLRPKSAKPSIRAQPVNPRSRNCHSSAAYDWHIAAGVEYDKCGCVPTAALRQVCPPCQSGHPTLLLCAELPSTYCRVAHSHCALVCRYCAAQRAFDRAEWVVRIWCVCSNPSCVGECNNPHRNRGVQL